MQLPCESTPPTRPRTRRGSRGGSFGVDGHAAACAPRSVGYLVGDLVLAGTITGATASSFACAGQLALVNLAVEHPGGAGRDTDQRHRDAPPWLASVGRILRSVMPIYYSFVFGMR